MAFYIFYLSNQNVTHTYVAGGKVIKKKMCGGLITYLYYVNSVGGRERKRFLMSSE